MNISERPFDRQLSSVILKVTNSCNLRCPYCFMFRGVDSSFKKRPKAMSEDVIIKSIEGIREFISSSGSEDLSVIIHGGEPLMLGFKKMSLLISELYKLKDVFGINISIQTNGIMINEDFIDMFLKYGVTVGVSLDGYPEIQNKTKTANGDDSYPHIKTGLGKIISALDENHFKGVLSVIDLNADPVNVYRHFLELGIKRMEFLLPLRNHKNAFNYKSSSLKYFEWLLPIFNQFIQDDDDTVDIRIFTSIIDLLIGSQMPMCSIRHSALDILVIETNGNIELVDDLRICGYNFTDIGLNIFKNPIDSFFDSKRVLEMYNAEKFLPEKCASCEYLNICGSGGHAFRYGPDETYNHPSIYCEDTFALISHIANNIFE